VVGAVGGGPAVVAPRAAPEADVPADAARSPVVEARPASLDAAREDLAAGRYDAALEKAAQPTRMGTGGEWQLVRGDALRALRRSAEAASAFESASTLLDGSPRLEASYTAAYIRYRDLHDGEGALGALGAADAKGSPLEE